MYDEVKQETLQKVQKGMCMAQRIKTVQEQSSSVPSGLTNVNPSPVIARRDPTTGDLGYSLGQVWINKVSGNIFALGAVAAGSATWTTLGSVSSTFTTLTAGTLTTSTAATSITLSTGNVFTGVGTNAAVGFTFTPKGTGGLTLTTGPVTLSNGNVVFSTAGTGLSVKSGANARIGQATLVLGTIAVANTSVTANTRVFLTRSSAGLSAALGTLESVVNAGVGFTINSYDSAAGVETNDISVVDWFMVESA